MNDVRAALRRIGGGDPGVRFDSDRFADAALARGILDVAYATVESPLGPLVAAATRRGLVRLAYLASEDESIDSVLEDLADTLSPRVLEAPSRLDEVRRELDEYFAGRRQTFDLPLDWSLVAGFHRSVLRTTARIPFGAVASYGEVARRAGSPRAARAAGNALAGNPVPIVVPCHRVVAAGGALGGYTGGLDRKRFLLDLEGVSI
ncbi:MAG: methylated-DNA--[protein]-cysteine S-methyltransferase [Actinomycetota bacterium]